MLTTQKAFYLPVLEGIEECFTDNEYTYITLYRMGNVHTWILPVILE